ncbi:putative polyketide synthase [Aspergillus tetrazonus]
MAAPNANRLLLFGPGAMSLDKEYFNRILAFVKNDPACQWAVHAIEDVESSWDALSTAIPKLQETPGATHARRLRDWIRTGSADADTTVANLPNAILGPLVVLAQLVEYLQYAASLAQVHDGDHTAFYVLPASQTETVGCCLGVFSALVVSYSASWAQFRHNAAAVLRSVFVLGALSDAYDNSDAAGASLSLIVFWRGGQSVSDLKKVLQKVPGAYISVQYDDNRATVTTPTHAASDLKGELQRTGFTTTETEFHGRFHAGPLYKKDLEAFLNLADKEPLFQLPHASSRILRTRINSQTNLADNEGSLLEVASRAFLVQQFDWVKTFRSAVSASMRDRNSRIIEFGPERCVPPSLLRRLNSQVTHYEFQPTTERQTLNENAQPPAGTKEDEVAVIGMACQVAGAQDLEEYWKILLEGESQHQPLVPNERFVMETVFRPGQEADDRKWYGNFLKDYDVFDYRFFKKTPREALHMDPQQRLILQTAYQAVAQSGYYHKPEADRRIGCYIGCVANDYENNVSHTTPTAFSATGVLRSYISGKVSHYFGWTGPGMVIDTACSASTVAIDLACRAILSGDCSAALAGGTNFYSTPMFFQNLAAGSFLSPTGQCKPFDAQADGYCRGEAVGAVFLKKLSNAIADGDQILGVISATAINQNQNDTPIFVPNPASLTNVFRTVVHKAGLETKDISLVEAHGTGTPVGDPAEYDSIRQVFGGPVRAGLEPLQIGSVKGLIGHTEGASGVIALIKILLSMQEGRIPPQASFNTISPSIKASPSDNMQITKTAIPWIGDTKAALINNYGAAGSNASMVIKQSPSLTSRRSEADFSSVSSPFRTPIYISGFDDNAIRAYASRLRQFINAKIISADKLGCENLAFNINRQANWSLGRGYAFAAQSLSEIDEKLFSFETFAVPATRPVILCFGGQVSKSVGLDRAVYEKATVLRQHLDQCDSVCRSIGAGSIFPGIFEKEAIHDPSVLQPLLFSLQYACAMSWIDSGVRPAAVVGHSFGELVALSVSGVLSLEKALKLVYGRSKIIKESWGPDKGSMLAIEADQADVEKLLDASNARLPATSGTRKATIACFNGSKSFTIGGPTAAIDALQEEISGLGTPFKHKRLDVTNAFHSTLVEDLVPQLETLGRAISFGNPTIPLERATEQRESGPLSASYVARHMRDPVYFGNAVQRLSSQYPEAIWLEAGSNSTITSMAARALGTPKASTFQPVSLTGTTQGLRQLADATINLWKAGLRTAFWLHSTAQTYEYAPIMLPPYQFEKHRHWLEFKPPPEPLVIERFITSGDTKLGASPLELYTLIPSINTTESAYQFRVNTSARPYVDVVSGYRLGKGGVQASPPTFAIDIAIRAITSARPQLFGDSGLHPQVYNVLHASPLALNPPGEVFLEFERTNASPEGWTFKLVSQVDGSPATLHLSGQLQFRASGDTDSVFEFNRLERLVSRERYLQVMNSTDDSDEVIQGKSIYSVLSDYVAYAETFRGVQKLVGRPSESAGRVVKRRSTSSWLDFSFAEVVSQVGSIWANCLAPSRSNANTVDTIYVVEGIEQWVRAPSTAGLSNTEGDEWQVFATHQRSGAEDRFITDIFVFDFASGHLAEVLLGVKFSPRSLDTLFTSTTLVGATITPSVSQPLATTAPVTVMSATQAVSSLPVPAAREVTKRNTKAEIWAKLLPVLVDISGLEPGEISETDALADIGIDSLMGMEMAREVETTFNCKFEIADLMSIVDVPGIISHLQSVLGCEDGSSSGAETPSSEATPGTPPSSNSSVSAGLSARVSEEDLTKSSAGQTTVRLPSSAILEAFREANAETDSLLRKWGCAGYLNGVSQKQTKLCLALTARAFKQLGCDLEAAHPGQVLQPVPYVEQHHRFHEYLYKMLEETRIINVDGGTITRTSISLPAQSAEAILDDLMRHHPDDAPAHQLTYNIGSFMADVLSGKANGPQLIFGDAKNRQLVAAFYGELPFNKLYFQQMADILTRLAGRLQCQSPLKILEMGAGTGGTTKVLVPALAKLGIPIEYTFTDLSPSLVAQARKHFKQYPFMKFAVHDIEQPPSEPSWIGSQHIVIASNAVHATRSLHISTQNIRKFLRPDGFLTLLEMNSTLHWVDVVWGTLEGWWLFEDGRTHAVVDEQRWRRELVGAGYKHVEWTDGSLPEVRVQRVIIALAGDVEEEVKTLPPAAHGNHQGISLEDALQRKVAADNYVRAATKGFEVPASPGGAIEPAGQPATRVLVTGATGSLGAHLVAHLISLASVAQVYCLNRPVVRGARSKDAPDPLRRQLQSFEAKSVTLTDSERAKLTVLETDASEAQLGLDEETYGHLVANVTHIIHNAFPVNGLRTLQQNEPQFTIQRNLVDLAAAASVSHHQASNFKVTFQFISSLSAVGMYPSTHGGEIRVPEAPLDIDSSLPNGYGGAKIICERILHETLGQHPDRFRSMTVRLGQLSGSRKTGYWNHMEVLGFLFKSAQTLRSLPDVDGFLTWLPLEDATATLADLLLRDDDSEPTHPVYHVDNPIHKPWKEMTHILADALDIPAKNIIPLDEWLRRVRAFPGEDPWDNPADKAMDFFEHKFEHMSCGGVTLATDNARKHSSTLANVQPVNAELVQLYLRVWRESGFLR